MVKDGSLFKYNDTNIKAIRRLIKDSKDVLQKVKVIGESEKRCAKLQPIVIPELVTAII